MKRKLLWVGDAVVSSGFGRITREVLNRISKYWDVSVLGINYFGDPHNYNYPIYPAYTGGDGWGYARLPSLINVLAPDVVVVLNDPWNIPRYMDKIGNTPTVATMPVDGKNCRGRGLNGLNLAIFWTGFGLEEARKGGYTGSATIIPLGVDLNIYSPGSKEKAREKIGLPPRARSAFIVGNVNRNQPRKWLDLTVYCFSKWIKQKEIDDAYLYLHICPTGDKGFDLAQLAQYYGVSNRLILAEPEIAYGTSEEMLVETYRSFDVMLTTTQGEGWGLPTMEGMACGIPQIVPKWSGLAEWTGNAVMKMPCEYRICTPNLINVVGGLPSEVTVIECLNDMYKSEETRNEFALNGITHVNNLVFNWDNIADRYITEIDKSLTEIVS